MKAAVGVIAFMLGFGAWLSGCDAQSADSRYSLTDTEVVPFAAKDGIHKFNLLVSLPRHYADDGTAHPVIYLLDADYSFAIARNVLRHFNDRSQLQGAIIVGLAYPDADANLDVYKRTRTRDYTPSHTNGGGYGPKFQKLSGGGGAFLDVLAEEVLPFIDKRYRTDPKARMLVGHSYGGLFATYAMLTRPGLFRDYLIVSPSYWYDDGMIDKLADRYISAHSALPPPAERSAEVAARVAKARDIQRARFDGEAVRTNADAEGELLDRIATPEPKGVTLLTEAAERMRLSARGFSRVLRVARTIADLSGAPHVLRPHVAEALSYRRIALQS